MKRILYTLTALSLFSMSAVAQSSGGAADPHFSQFYGAPLTLNPAMTGAFDCNYRITAIYRTQWGSVLKEDAVPMFSTPAIGLDFRTNKGFTPSGAFGFGLSGLSDRAGQSKFMTNRVGLSLAYHQALDRRSEHFVSVGFQSEIWQRSISYDGLQFPLQNNNGSFDGTLPNGEYLVNNNFLSWDISAGLLYTGRFGRSGRSSGYIGAAAHHLTRPTESFLGDKSVRVPMKFTFHGGFRFKIKGRFDAQPKFIYMNQGVSHELNIGNDFRFIFEEREPEGNNFRFGAMFRMVGGDNKAAWKDKVLNPEAVILNAAIEFSKITVGVAYDINVSQLVNASKTFGAFEIHAGYIGCFPRTRPQTIFCPKF
jgi:type IX secretion system PorP/SprF family membrane protein